MATGIAAVVDRAHAWELLVLAAALALYGNGVSLAMAGAIPAGGWPGVALGMAPAAGMLFWGWRVAGLAPRDLGLGWRGAVRSAGFGLLVALALALVALVFLHAPPLVGRPVTHGPVNSMSLDALLSRALVWMPLDTALPEEVAFRGVLLAALMRRFSSPAPVLLSTIAFTLWHVVVVVRTLAVTNIADEPLFVVIGYVGAIASVFVGGLIFAALRIMTGNLAGSIVAHWAFNAVLLVGIYALGR